MPWWANEPFYRLAYRMVYCVDIPDPVGEVSGAATKVAFDDSGLAHGALSELGSFPMIPPIGRKAKPLRVVACAPKPHHQNVQTAWQPVAETAGWTYFGGPLVSAYLVRLIKSHDIVGFFTADDLDEPAIDRNR